MSLWRASLNASISAFDVYSFAEYDKDNCISSPNMPFIPNPHLYPRKVHLRQDARYWIDDHTRWPQLYLSGFPHLMCIPRSRRGVVYFDDAHPSAPDVMFEDPSESWLTPLLHANTPSMFRLSRLICDQLRLCGSHMEKITRELIARESTEQGFTSACVYLLQTLQHTITRLHDIPMSRRDLWRHVTEAQRYWLELQGIHLYMDVYAARVVRSSGFEEPPQTNRELLGVFTYTAHTVQRLCDAGIPVWYIRPRSEIAEDSVCRSIVDLVNPCATLSADEWLDGEVRRSYPIIYQGSTVDPEFITCRYRFSRDYVNNELWSRLHPETVSRTLSMPHSKPKKPLRPTPYARGAPKLSKINAQNALKFQEPRSDLMPPDLEIWTRALHAFAQKPCEDPLVTKPLGYLLPQARMFLALADERMNVHVMKWLSFREAWFGHVMTNGHHINALKPQEWRDFLSQSGASSEISKSNSTKTALAHDAMSKKLGPFVATDWNFKGSLGDIKFMGTHVWENAEKRDILVQSAMQMILHELIHLNFIFELDHLDHIMVPIGGYTYQEKASHETFLHSVYMALGGLHLNTAQNPLEPGLADKDQHSYVKAVDSFRSLLHRWHSSPPILAYPLEQEQVELPKIHEIHSICAAFYIKTSYHHCGRAPEVPHAMPRKLVTVSCI
ncbi:hypothetical protein SISNIDRAFT_461388 [Sistotremastrum niveocremeum HHB9708]|uniref:Uncharacterized protein n=2 Tax=Sistotremastraceae TaxID=3402574 RepID=A0A164MMU6_9AGAM|nr:hypothetical protein SISNIDRAFT_461388 [Sistotremastrum niveocremeum HHB9708]KZT38520.1 hypothetical protein SISSUDRAFT_1128703 [Sistotremastrum suecicum HHB10207 ss-3]